MNVSPFRRVIMQNASVSLLYREYYYGLSNDTETNLQSNASVSLLSGNIYYGLSNDTETNLQSVDSTCSSTFTVYVYDSLRLMAMYGAVLGIAVLVVACGSWLRFRNGVEDKMVFSHVVHIALNEDLLHTSDSGGIHDKTRLQLKRGTLGKLIQVPPPPVDDGPDSSNPPSVKPERYGEYCITNILSILLIVTCSLENGLTEAQVLKSVQPRRMENDYYYPAGSCCAILHHFYYHFLDGKAPSPSFCISGCPGWINLKNQVVVSEIGIALAYAGQTLFAIVVGASSVQLFWRRIRSRGLQILEVDALMKVRSSPVSPSLYRACCASLTIPFFAFLAASTSILSIFAPGALRVSTSHLESKECTVPTPRNLSIAIGSNTDGLFYTPIITVLSSGTYLAPLGSCGPGDCSYNLEFIGPGFECHDVTASSNATEFISGGPGAELGDNVTNLFQASIAPQTEDDLTMQLFVQTWDTVRSVYQAVNCTAVLRSYSVLISHNTTSAIDVTESQTISTIQANTSNLSTFAETYTYNVLSTLVQSDVSIEVTESLGVPITFISSGLMMMNIGTFQLDGEFACRENMTVALEEFAQNATLSLLSGQIFAFNKDDSELLENVTTTCAYRSTAYEYTPYRLFLPYGVVVLMTSLCAVWGSIAARRNAVEESMDFSRFLRAVLNNRMFDARENLDKNTRVRANDNVEGDIVPLES